MKNENKALKEDLKDICNEFIELLKKLENNNMISHEEYLYFSKRKLDFLDMQ